MDRSHPSSTAPTPATTRQRLSRAGHQVRRAILARRRLLCALCLAGAAFATLRTLAPAPPDTVSVLVAARDLPAGATVAGDDLTTVDLPPEALPDHAASASYAVGRTLASPVRRGEPLTDARLVGASLLEGYPGRVAVPLRLPDRVAADLLRVGDHIDLLATDQRTGSTTLVGGDMPVIAMPQETASTATNSGLGRLIVLGVTSGMSENVASAAATQHLTATISR